MAPAPPIQNLCLMGSMAPDFSDSADADADADRLNRLLRSAVRVLGTEPEALEWFQAPHPLLNGAPPADLMRTEEGAAQVERLLWRLEFSLPA